MNATALQSSSLPEEHYDVIVAGGGPSGIAAAMAAASGGVRTLLIERFGRLGGMSTNGMVNQIPLMTNTPYVRRIYHSLAPHSRDSEFLDIVYFDWLEEFGAEVHLHTPLCGVLPAPNTDRQVAAVQLATPRGLLVIQAKCVIDATGDGTAAFLAGADYEMGRASDGLMQPATIMFRVSGVDHARSMEANGGRSRYRFPEGYWNHVTMAAHAQGELPRNVGMVRTYMAARDSDRYINATQVNAVDATDIRAITRAEVDGRRQVAQIMAFLRDRAPGYENAYVSLMPSVLGVRESRRFKGVETLTREDCLNGRKWDDAIAVGCRAPLDVHNPAGPGQAEGVSKENPAGKDPRPAPYDIPFGCLVPEKVNGLLLAGRCISGDHDAHASYRFQTICMATGAAAGFAAAESLFQNVLPRNVDITPVQRRLGIKKADGNGTAK